MKIRYDPDADAMYIQVRDENVSFTKEVDKNTLIDFNDQKKVIGVELLFVKERNPNLLSELEAEKLLA